MYFFILFWLVIFAFYIFGIDIFTLLKLHLAAWFLNLFLRQWQKCIKRLIFNVRIRNIPIAHNSTKIISFIFLGSSCSRDFLKYRWRFLMEIFTFIFSNSIFILCHSLNISQLVLSFFNIYLKILFFFLAILLLQFWFLNLRILEFWIIFWRWTNL